MITKFENPETSRSFQAPKAPETDTPPKLTSPFLKELPIEEIFSGDLPPLPSRAMRRIARRSKSSSRGGVVVQLPSWSRPRIVYFESKLEQRVLFLLLARGDLIDLREQPPSIIYLNLAGKKCSHYPDFLVQLSSGRRLAIAVKPAKLVDELSFVNELVSVRNAMGKDYADDLILITDQDFSKAEALNAERYHEFSRSKDKRAFERLKEIIPSLTFPTTIAELMSSLQAGDQGFRTVFIAIYEGLLLVNRTDVIETYTSVYQGVLQ